MSHPSPLALVVLLLPSLATAETIIVDYAGGGDATTIQQGIDMATAGDVVLVRPGPYTDTHSASLPWGSREVNVEMREHVDVVSEGGPFVTSIGGAADYGVLFPPNASSKLEGFRIEDVSVGSYVFQARPIITGNIFVGHRAEAVQMNEAGPFVISNTIVGVMSFGIRGQLESSAVISHNIVVFGEDVGVFCELPGAMIECNDVYGNPLNFDGNCEPDESNISDDPLFCDLAGGNYALTEGSPAAPENSPEGCGLIGAVPVGCDIVVSAPPSLDQVLERWSVRPNPARAFVTLTVPSGVDRVSIYDVGGRLLRTLLVPAGAETATWDTRDDAGRRVAPGAYFLSAGRPGDTRRLVVLR